jgi:hypothetical protein
MKKILILPLTVLFFHFTGVANAQKVEYRGFYLGMGWEEYIERIVKDRELSMDKLKKDCENETRVITDSNRDEFTEDEFNGYQRYILDSCLKKSVGNPDCEFGRVEVLFDDKVLCNSRGRPVSLFHGKLVKIVIKIRQYETSGIIESIHEKWGKPHRREIVPFQNTYGAVVDGWTETWYVGNNMVFLMKIPEKIDQSYYVYKLVTRQQQQYDNENKVERPKL